MYNSKNSQLSDNGNYSLNDHSIPHTTNNLSSTNNTTNDDNTNFSQSVQQSLLGGPDMNHRILTHSTKAPIAPPHASKIEMRSAKRHQCDARQFKPKSIEHLRAPYLSTDYSHSALSWSVNNRLAVGLGEQVYIFEIETNRPTQLETPLKPGEVTEGISALQFSPDGTHIAIGRTTRVEIYDVNSGKCLRRIKAHNQSICDIAWYNGRIFALTSEDGTISIHNLSQKLSLMTTLVGHNDAVLSCKWSFGEYPQYLATGSLDNTVKIWDMRCLGPDSNNIPQIMKPLITYIDSIAATKALAWCPFVDGHLLAVGGGTGDGKVRFYDINADNAKLCSGSSTSSLTYVNYIDTGSQITSLQWAIDEKELVTTHGFKNPRDLISETANSICTWRYPELVRTSCTNHFSDRILFGTVCPLGSFIAFGEATDNQSIAQQGSVYLYQMWETLEEKQARMASSSSGKASLSKIGTKIR